MKIVKLPEPLRNCQTLKKSGEGEIHFRVITADTGTSGMVTGM